MANDLIGLVLVAHGQLGLYFVKALEHIVGPQDQLASIAIGPHDDMELRRSEIEQAISDVDSGKGVIILSDMFGGTPSNLAISFLQAGKTEVIAGMNLPMLIRLESARKTMAIADAVVAAREAGRHYILVASEALDQETDHHG